MLPAAIQEFLYITSLPEIETCSRIGASSRSKGVAVALSSVFSVNLRAVSFTTANVSGSISFRIFSVSVLITFLSRSISL